MKLKNWRHYLYKYFIRHNVCKNHWPKFLLEYGNMLLYKEHCGYTFDLNHPITFPEKIQWYKTRFHLKDQDRYVDKYLFKGLIEEKLGQGHTIPCYGSWTNLQDFKVAWKHLPEKFCLKSNAQSDGKYIKVIEKSKTDLEALLQELQGWLNPLNLLIHSYCSAYYKVKPRILAEEYVENVKDQLYDYKFYCFRGVPHCVCASMNHFTDDTYPITYYDLEWNKLNVRSGKHKNDDIPQPPHFKEMIRLAYELSKNLPFIRVDFFDTPQKLYVAELTFYPGGGLFAYTPDSYNHEMGKLMDIENKIR